MAYQRTWCPEALIISQLKTKNLPDHVIYKPIYKYHTYNSK